MSTYLVNSDTVARTWGRLVNADTGSTLELAPSEGANVLCWSEPAPSEDGQPNEAPELVELGADFRDRWLVPGTPPAAPAAPSPSRVTDDIARAQAAEKAAADALAAAEKAAAPPLPTPTPAAPAAPVA